MWQENSSRWQEKSVWHSILVAFGLARRVLKTAEQLAACELESARRALLDAHREREDAAARVSKLQRRIARLEEQISATAPPEVHAAVAEALARKRTDIQGGVNYQVKRADPALKSPPFSGAQG